MKTNFLWRIVLVLGVVLAGAVPAQAETTDSVFALLRTEIARRPQYQAEKEKRINSIRADLVGATTPRQRFDTSLALFREYRSFQSDSAYHYASSLRELADVTASPQDVAVANMALLDYFTSVGFFKEAAETKAELHAEDLPESYLPAYYHLCNRYAQNLSAYVGGPSTPLGRLYNDQRIALLDSLIAHTDPSQAQHALAILEREQLLSPATARDIEKRLKLLSRHDFSDHHKAVQYSIIGREYLELGRTEDAMHFLALSAIHDIRGNIKETTAAKMLAELLHSAGDNDRAYALIHIAFDDADFYNSHLRKEETSTTMRMIEVEQHGGMKNRVWLMGTVAFAIFLLLLLSVWLLLKIRKKNRNIEAAHLALREKSEQLDAKNAELNDLLSKLHEVTEIKDQYIMQTLYINSNFVNKVEEQSRQMLKSLKEKKYDKVKFFPYELGIKEERARIYQSFDKAFLSLFPNFIREVNALFPADAPMLAEDATELPMDIRIFALLRLGITDTQEIAEYLNLSVNTVYVYRTRVKSKATVPGKDFEARIMAIPKP